MLVKTSVLVALLALVGCDLGGAGSPTYAHIAANVTCDGCGEHRITADPNGVFGVSQGTSYGSPRAVTVQRDARVGRRDGLARWRRRRSVGVGMTQVATRAIAEEPIARSASKIIAERGELQMPPLATRVVDSANVAVITAWIQAKHVDTGAPDADP